MLDLCHELYMTQLRIWDREEVLTSANEILLLSSLSYLLNNNETSFFVIPLVYVIIMNYSN